LKQDLVPDVGLSGKEDLCRICCKFLGPSNICHVVASTMTLLKEGAAMIPLDVMFVFIGVATALAAVPGPDNILVLTQSALHGRLAGLIVTLGLASGLMFHTTAVAFGAAVLFQTSQYAFVVSKYAGAAYLLYLA
jgi:hypothetical protein